MKLCALLLILLTAIPTWPATAKTADPCQIRVVLGQQKSVSVTLPCMKRQDLAEIISTFFGKGDEAAKKHFEAVLNQSGELTLTLTTHKP